MLRSPGGAHWHAWLGLALFGPGTLVFAWLLVRPQQLHLDRHGFTVAGGLVRTPRPVRWRDIDVFFVYRLPRGGKMIGFNYAPGVRPLSALGAVGRRFGADGAISKGWRLSPEAMVEDLNAYRERALAEASVDRTARQAFGKKP